LIRTLVAALEPCFKTLAVDAICPLSFNPKTKKATPMTRDNTAIKAAYEIEIPLLTLWFGMESTLEPHWVPSLGGLKWKARTIATKNAYIDKLSKFQWVLPFVDTLGN
jgi:hypothetical protein